VRSFIDTVSKNGNLLLNIGPRGEDAQIPREQIARLTDFGAWLKANGEGIYGTRPWTRFDGKTRCGMEVRFTTKADALYVHLLGTPSAAEFVVKGDDIPAVSQATHLASGNRVACRRDAAGLRFELTAPLASALAHAFKLSE